MAQGIGKSKHQKHHANQAADPFGHFDVHRREHDPRQHHQAEGTNGVVGAMLQIDELIKGPLAHQHQGDRTDEQGPQAEAGEDQGQLGGDRKGADRAIEAEGSIEQLQVDQAGDATAGGGPAHGLLFAAKGFGHGGADDLQHQADHPGNQQLAPVGRRDPDLQQQQHHQGKGDLQGFDPAGAAEPRLNRPHPVQALGFVEEVAQADHQQEHAAEGQDARLGQLEQLVVGLGMVKGVIKGGRQADATRQANQ